jgi:hypothetical protein
MTLSGRAAEPLSRHQVCHLGLVYIKRGGGGNVIEVAAGRLERFGRTCASPLSTKQGGWRTLVLLVVVKCLAQCLVLALALYCAACSIC